MTKQRTRAVHRLHEHIPWPIAIVLIVLIPMGLMWLVELVATGHDVRWLIIPGTSFVFAYYMLWDYRCYFKEPWFWWSLIGLVVLGAVFWIAVIASGVHLRMFGLWGVWVLENYALLVGFGFLEQFFLQRANAKNVV
jgi:hypothetical protein